MSLPFWIGATNGWPLNLLQGLIGDASTFAGIGLALVHLNCHERRCWRLGRYTTQEANGHAFRRCRKHHQQRHP